MFKSIAYSHLILSAWALKTHPNQPAPTQPAPTQPDPKDTYEGLSGAWLEELDGFGNNHSARDWIDFWSDAFKENEPPK